VTIFPVQLGYTKKQEERHFRGVIVLEVCLTFGATIMNNILPKFQN
jgi:hypothetical protein